MHMDHIGDLFPGLVPTYDFDDGFLVNTDMARSNTGSVTGTPILETGGEALTSAPKPEVTTAPSPQPDVCTPADNKKSKSKGRSGGDKSSASIKALRVQAGKGDLDAAMKLGWGIDRITKIFNQKKVERGEKVASDQPIDDPALLARIAEKRKYQAEVQKKRQEKLRLRAYSGDYEAARKLKMGKKRMEELFPTLSEKSKQQEDNGEDVPVEASREKTPAEPLDYDQEQSQMENGLPQSGLPMLPAGGQMLGHGLSVSPFDIIPPKVQGDPKSLWQNVVEPNFWLTQSHVWSQSYQTIPGGFDSEPALRREYEEAVQRAAVAQENLARVKQELENVQAFKSLGSMRKREPAIKTEDDEPKSLLYYKKAKKARPSNFPTHGRDRREGSEIPVRYVSPEITVF